MPDWLEDAENGLSMIFRELWYGLWEDFRHLEERAKALDRQLDGISTTHPDARRLE